MIAQNIEKMLILISEHTSALQSQGAEAEQKLNSGDNSVTSKSVFDPWISQVIEAIQDFNLVEDAQVKEDLIFGQPQEQVDFNGWQKRLDLNHAKIKRKAKSFFLMTEKVVAKELISLQKLHEHLEDLRWKQELMWSQIETTQSSRKETALSSGRTLNDFKEFLYEFDSKETPYDELLEIQEKQTRIQEEKIETLIVKHESVAQKLVDDFDELALKSVYKILDQKPPKRVLKLEQVKVCYKESVRGIQNQQFDHQIPATTALESMIGSNKVGSLRLDEIKFHGNFYFDFILNNDMKTTLHTGKQATEQIELNQDAQRIGKVDMNYNGSYFCGLVFYNEVDQEIGKIGLKADLTKTIKFEKDEFIVGMRAKMIGNSDFYDFQLITIIPHLV